MIYNNRNGDGTVALRGIILGGVAGILVLVAGILVVPIFIVNESIDEKMLSITAVILQSLSLFVGAFVLGKTTNRIKWIGVYLFILIYLLAMASVGMLFFQIDLNKMLCGVMSGIISGGCCILALHKKKTSSKRIAKKRGHR